MKNDDTVWIVGQHLALYDEGGVWDFQGIVLTEEEAVEACRGDDGEFREYWFVGSARVGSILPAERVDWPNTYYPAERENDGG